MFVIDPAGFACWNPIPRCSRITGLQAGEVEGANLLDLLDSESRERAETLLTAVRLTRRGRDGAAAGRRRTLSDVCLFGRTAQFAASPA